MAEKTSVEAERDALTAGQTVNQLLQEYHFYPLDLLPS